MNQRKVRLPGETGCLGKLELTCFPGGTSGKEPTCQCRRHETWVPSLGQEDALEKEMATHSSILAWESCEQRSLADYIPWGRRVRYDWCDLAHTEPTD